MLACGVENMSRLPIGSDADAGAQAGYGKPISRSYFGHYEFTSQFEGAERIADKYGITREEADALRPRVPGAGRAGPSPRAASRPRSSPSTSTCVDEDGAAHRRDAPRSPATRSPARPPSRSWPSSSRSPAPTACTPPARRRRSPTAPRAVLLMSAERPPSAGPAPAGPGAADGAGRLRPGADARGPDPGHRASCSPAPGPGDRRHRRLRDQRGVRLGRAGLGPGGRPRHGPGQPERRRHRARPSRSAAPAASSSPRPSTSCSAPTARYGLITMCCGGGLGTGTLLERV